ncbi:MAG: SurA N-terminal domain-containing protein [Anaerolineae bacterium]
MTRKEYLRRRKDQRQRQTLLAVVVPILVAVVLFLSYGVYAEVFRGPREPVARVNDENITTGEFQKRVNWERWSLLSSVNQFASLAQSSDPSILQQFFEPQRTNIGDNTVSVLVDEALIRQEAAARGIVVDDTAIDQQIADDMATVVAPPPTVEAAEEEADGSTESDTSSEADDGEATSADEPADAEADAAGEEDAAGEADAAGESDEGAAGGDADTTAGGVTGADAITDTAATTVTLSAEEVESAFADNVQRLLDQTGLTRADYRHLLQQQLLRDKLTEALGAEVPITDKQVEAEYLVFESKDTAEQAVAELTDGEAWATIVDRYLREESEETTGVDATDAITSTTEAGLAEDVEASDVVTDTEEAPAAEDIESTGVVTDTEEAPVVEDVEASDVVTDTEEAPAAEDITATDELTTTAGLTTTEELAATGEITGTESVTETAPAPTPWPTAAPNPYAFEHGERRWYSVDTIKERLGLSDADAGEVMDLDVMGFIGPFSGSRGQYVLIVFDVDESRELEESELETRRAGVLEPWLTEARSNARIDRFSLEGKIPSEPDWFIAGWERYVVPVPTIDPGAFGVPIPGDSGLDVTVGDEAGDAGADVGGEAGSDAGASGNTGGSDASSP